VVKKTAAFIPAWGTEVNEKKDFAANAMTWKSTGQVYSEKTDWPKKTQSFPNNFRIFSVF
jgi:hypothetical protein